MTKPDIDIADKCPRPCSECADGLHHWLEQCCDDDGKPITPRYECKHCDALAGHCDECGGAALPYPSDLCGECAGNESMSGLLGKRERIPN